jgi:hypothetical protein
MSGSTSKAGGCRKVLLTASVDYTKNGLVVKQIQICFSRIFGEISSPRIEARPRRRRGFDP